MQTRNMFPQLSVCLALTWFVSIAIQAGDKRDKEVKDPALAQFMENTKVYLELRQGIEKDLTPLKDKENAHEIKAHQQTLRLKLAAARAGFQQGCMFTPEAAAVFKRILSSEMRGPGGNTARKTVMEDSPKAIPCKVNAAYPSTEPVSTVPPELLMKMPELPDNLEYRFVQRSLILRDAKANMIVDCLPNALPPAGGGMGKAVATENKPDRKTDSQAEKKTE